MIEEHIKGIEEEIGNVYTKRMIEIGAIIKSNQKILKEKENVLERQDRAYKNGIYTLEEFKVRRTKLEDEMDSFSVVLTLIILVSATSSFFFRGSFP